jgi:hypothetical protein
MSGQPDFSTAPRPRRAPVWERLALAVACAALLLSGFAAWRAREEALAARARLAEVRREVEAASGRLRVFESQIRAVSPLLPAVEAPPVRVVAVLASVLPRDARLEGLTIDYERGVLELRVVAREAAAWDLLLDRLEREPHLREVEPGPEARDAEVRSVVRARWAGGAP